MATFALPSSKARSRAGKAPQTALHDPYFLCPAPGSNLLENLDLAGWRQPPHLPAILPHTSAPIAQHLEVAFSFQRCHPRAHALVACSTPSANAFSESALP